MIGYFIKVIGTTCLLGLAWSKKAKNNRVVLFQILFGTHPKQSVVLEVDQDDDQDYGLFTDSFSTGNLLFTNPNGHNPNQILEFTMDGDNVSNYTTWVQDEPTARCVANDLAFLNSSTLLLLDTEQGIFYSSHKGNVKGIWSGLKNNIPGKTGCDLQRFTVDQVNKKIYVISTNIKCDYSYIPGIFIYDLNGNYLSTLTYSGFNMTLGVTADSKGTIWVVDVHAIFVFHKSGEIDTYDPVADKLAYNGILVTKDNTFYVSVPAPNSDLIIELDTKGNLLQTIKLIGDTLPDGSLSSIPGTMVIDPASGHIVVECPYASKTLDKDAYVIQIYSTKGNLKDSWGGHSCKSKNALCIPLHGLVVIPKQ
eukprot:gene12055-14106_t